MKLFIILIVFLFSNIFAKNIEIESKLFDFNSTKKLSVFKKDVNLTDGNNTILSDVLYVYLDKKNHPIKAIAQDNVKFTLKIGNNSIYNGQCKKLTYLVQNDKFILEGNVSILKSPDNQKIYGDKFIINKKTKDTKIISGEKPVKFIFKVKE